MKRPQSTSWFLLLSLLTACGRQLVEFECGHIVPQVLSITATPAMPDTGDVVQVSAATIDRDTDPMGACRLAQSMTYKWTLMSAPAGARATLSATDSAVPWFRPDLHGTYTVRLVVTDSTGLASQPKDLAILVAECGSKLPVINAITPSTVSPFLGQLVSLSAAVTDNNIPAPCGKLETLSYAWTMIMQPALSISQLQWADTPRPTFIADAPGAYKLQLTVTDSDGHVSAPVQSPTINAGVCGTSAPVAQIGIIAPFAVAAPAPAPPQVAVQAPLGVPLQLDASTSSDPDNAPTCMLAVPQTLGFTWRFEQLPQGSRATLNDTHDTTPSFTPDVPGIYVVDLIATDSTGLNSLAARVQINGFNPQPMVAAGAGPYTSLALDGADPRIAFYDQSGGGAFIATCNGAGCATNPIWSINPIDKSNPAMGRMISLAATTGMLYAVYWDGANCQPMYGVSSDGGKSWQTSLLQANNNKNGAGCTPMLDNVGDGACAGINWGIDWRDHGAFPSVAISPISGNPVVAFVGYVEGARSTCRNGNNRDIAYAGAGYDEIRMAVCIANCKSNNPTWVIRSAAVATAGRNAKMGYTSIAFDPSTKRPAISFRSSNYNGNDQNAVGYVTCTANCEVNPVFSTLVWVRPDTGFDAYANGQSAGSEATTTSLAISTTSEVQLAYFDGRNKWLRLDGCRAGCDVANNWSGRVIDATGSVGQYASLALSPMMTTLDRPSIAYLSRSGTTLRYARQALDGSWSWTDIDSSAGYVSLKLTVNSGTRISHFTNTAVHYFSSGN